MGRRGLRPPRDIIEFIEGKDFLHDRTMSSAQRSVLKAIYGLKMDEPEAAAFMAMHEGRGPRPGGYDEASLGFGRRSGKGEKIGANVVAYESVMFDPKSLAPGETAYGIMVAQNERQARIVRDFVEAKLRLLEEKGWPVFEKTEQQIKSVTAEVIRLANRVNIACFPCKKVSTRGLTGLVIVLDEIGHWQLEPNAYNADKEIVRAVRPTRATLRSRGFKVPLLKTSTPFDEVGVLYEDWKNRERTNQLVLHEVPTKFLNPTITDALLAEEQFADPESYDREYLAKWGTGGDHKPFPMELVEACVDRGRQEVPPSPGTQYWAWIDAAFKRDNFAFGLAHRDGELAVVDRIRVWTPKPKRPLKDKTVVADIALEMLGYGIDRVHGDQFCDVPLRSEFEKHGIVFMERPVTESSKYLEYNNLAAAMRAKLVRLPDDAEMKRDLTGLRKKGKWIGAPNIAGRHDDISTVIRGLVYAVLPLRAGLDLAALNRRAMRFGELQRPEMLREARRRAGLEPDAFEGDIMGAVY